MTTRPLFDSPPTVKPKPRAGSKTPTLPARAKAPPEIWTLRVTSMPCDIPATVRIRKFLKMARRAYSLRAVSVAGPPPDSTPGDSMASNIA